MRCLIVDDSAGFRDAARTMLLRAGVAVVDAVANGAEALKCFANLQPDVTLVDIDLGAESGFDLVERLCRIGRPTPSAVILISSHAEQDFLELIDSSPAVGFLSKFDLTPGSIAALLCASRGCPDASTSL
ncbi:hypothetical protein A5662_13810 [Mycobacteriaceae bacterium 1482268.1]|nr:hypothetical protein A5662_13810 [Mycobacteriaceae bacterium 1482268.1]